MRFGFLMSVLMASSSSLAASALSSADLKAKIAEQGAKSVVDELVKQDRWDYVSNRIASGNADWLALVPMLATGTDAGPSEDLGIDLAFALPKNARAVLAIVDERKWATGGIIGIERVCGLPFVEDTKPTGYLPKAVRAVRNVSEPALVEKKQHCLDALSHTAASSRQ